MQWKIASENNNSVSINAPTLLGSLIQKHMEIQHEDIEVLAAELIDYLQSQRVLGQTKPEQLALIAFSLGYYYKVFKINNDPTIDTSGSSRSSSDTEQPADSKHD
jgi:hypothetical protein